MRGQPLGIELTATLEPGPPQLVSVRLGGTEIRALKPITRSKAGDGDDQEYWDSEERRVIEETVAAWLANNLGRPA